MKKHLHYLWATLFAVAALPAAAQDEVPVVDLKVGENVITTEETLFTFTPVESGLVMIEGCAIAPYNSNAPHIMNGSEKVAVPFAYGYMPDFMAFNGEKDVTYEFTYSTYFREGEEKSFKIVVSVTPVTEGSLSGETCEDPIIIPQDGTRLFPFVYGPDTTTVYAKYECEKDGRLIIKSTDSFRPLLTGFSCSTIDENWYDYDYIDQYIYDNDFMVEEGDVVYIKASGSSAALVSIEIESVVPGTTCKDAYELKEGVNEIPAAAGTYWYKMEAPLTMSYCALVVSSDAKATVELIYSCGYNGVVYETLNFRSKPIQQGSSRVLKVVKTEATAAPETFDVLFDKLKPIEDNQVGEALTSGVAMTTPVEEGSYYYSITAPEGNPTVMVLKSNASDVDYTQWSPAIKITELGGYSTLNYGNIGDDFKMQAVPGQTYMFEVTVKKEPITFTVSFEALEQGALSTYPLPAALTGNEVPAFSPVYYQFTPEKEFKLTLACDIEGAVINAQSGYLSWDGSYRYDAMELNKDENGVLWFKALAGTPYLFEIIKPEGKDDVTGTFTLAEAPFGPGESWTTAIPVEAGTVTLPDGPCDVWYQITSPLDGYFTMTDITMTYVWGNLIDGYAGVVDNNPVEVVTTYKDGQTIYDSLKVGVSNGQTVYVHIKNTQPDVAPTAVFGFKEAEPGEVASTAIALEYNDGKKAYDISGDLDYYTYKWYSIDLPAGILSVTSPNSMTVNLYSAENASQILASGSWNSGKDYGILNYAVEEGKYLLRFNGTSSYGEPQDVIPVTVVVRDPLPGETVATAITVTEDGQIVNVPVLDGDSYWVKMSVVPGDLNIVGEVTQPWYAFLYSSASMTSEIAETRSYGDERETMYYAIKDLNVTEKDVYYLNVYYCREGATLTFTGSAITEPDPEFPEELDVTVNAKGIEVTQEVDMDVYTVTVTGTTKVDNFTLTFKVPEGWDGFIGITDADMNPDIEPLGKVKKAAPVEWAPMEEMEAWGFKKTNELTFPVDGKEHQGSLYLYKGDQVDEANQILIVVNVESGKLNVNVNVNVEDGASFSYVVPESTATGFSLNLPADWKVTSAKLNNEDIEVASKYTVKVEEEDLDYVFVAEYDGELEFVSTTTGMVELDARVKIGVVDGKIRIEGTEVGDNITVYSLGGMLVGDYKAENTVVEISLAKGTYVVRVNNVAAKVLL